MYYQVWYAKDGEVNKKTVLDVDHAVRLINKWTVADLNDATIDYNAFGLEVREEGGEWEEYYDEDGKSVEEISNDTIELYHVCLNDVETDKVYGSYEEAEHAASQLRNKHGNNVRITIDKCEE